MACFVARSPNAAPYRELLGNYNVECPLYMPYTGAVPLRAEPHASSPVSPDVWKYPALPFGACYNPSYVSRDVHATDGVGWRRTCPASGRLHSMADSRRRRTW